MVHDRLNHQTVESDKASGKKSALDRLTQHFTACII